MAMLTNAYETQVVQSLGVRIGPDGGRPGVSASGSNCPFTGMIPGMGEARPDGVEGDAPAPVRWTAAAEARLANIPEFVRPMAKTGIERFARERGAREVDEQVLDAAKEFFGM
jgi:hypothetical protein